jgi:hypothetical protein
MTIAPFIVTRRRPTETLCHQDRKIGQGRPAF